MADVRISGEQAFKAGNTYLIGPADGEDQSLGYVADYHSLTKLRAGGFLSDEKKKFQVLDKAWMAGSKPSGSLFIKLKALDDFSIKNSLDLSYSKKKFSLTWITLSDKGSKKQRKDESGPLIENLLNDKFELCLSTGFIIPDDQVLLRSLVMHLACVSGFDFIITTGGTGLGLRDITPEVVSSIIDKRLPGFEQAMTASSLTKTPHAMISRAVAGTLNQSIIINLPGSPKGVRENLEVVLPALEHALKKLQGDPSDCASRS
ncbi:MAG: MogA/MoaB family molybdenum cofactor biosynthesis protein [Desulfovibrionales bacterium]|nr:MogA/MoaB family molybdenum cofactor biosynthesis protein [Desulfovibrionales bacterium]